MPLQGSLILALQQKDRVDLRKEGIDNDDLLKIAHLIHDNLNLIELDLSDNKITELTEEVQDLFVKHPLLYDVKLDNNHTVVTEKVVDEESFQYGTTVKVLRSKKNTKEVQVEKRLSRSKIMAFQERMDVKKKLMTFNEILKKIFEEFLESIKQTRSDTLALLENIDDILGNIEVCEKNCAKYPLKNEVIKKQLISIKTLIAGEQKIYAQFPSETLAVILKNPHINKGPVKALWFLHPPEAHFQKLPDLCICIESITFNIFNKHTSIPLSFLNDLHHAISESGGQLTLKDLFFSDVCQISLASFEVLIQIAQKVRVNVHSEDEHLKFSLSPKNLSVTRIDDSWFSQLISILKSPPYSTLQEPMSVSLDSKISEMQLLGLIELIEHRSAIQLRLVDNCAKVINHKVFRHIATKLTDLEITDATFDSEKMINEVIESCKNAPQLRRLSLRRCKIDDQYNSLVSQLGETITTLSLEELDLREVSKNAVGIIVTRLASKKTSLERIFISPPDDSTESFDQYITALLNHNTQSSTVGLGTTENLDAPVPISQLGLENTKLQSLRAVSPQGIFFFSVLQRNTDYVLLAKHAKTSKEVAECLDCLERLEVELRFANRTELANRKDIISSDLIEIFVGQIKRIGEIVKTAVNMKFLQIRCRTLFPAMMDCILKLKFTLSPKDFKVIYELLDLVKKPDYGIITDNYLPRIFQIQINELLKLSGTDIENIRVAMTLVERAQLPVHTNLYSCYKRIIEIIDGNLKDLSKRNLYLQENLPQWCDVINKIHEEKRLLIHQKHQILYQFYCRLALLGLLSNEPSKVGRMRDIAINYLIEQRTTDSLDLVPIYIHSQIYYSLLAQITSMPAHVTYLTISVITVVDIRKMLNEMKKDIECLLPLAEQIIEDYAPLFPKEPTFITKLRDLVEKLKEAQRVKVEITSGWNIRPAPLHFNYS